MGPLDIVQARLTHNNHEGMLDTAGEGQKANGRRRRLRKTEVVARGQHKRAEHEHEHEHEHLSVNMITRSRTDKHTAKQSVENQQAQRRDIGRARVQSQVEKAP